MVHSVDFEELTPVQRKALVEAFGEPSDYNVPSLRKVDDPVEAAGYEVFRDSLEGLEVERGGMEKERFESYLDTGILREEESGVVVNSVWMTYQIEEMKENGMLDLDSIEIYESVEEPELAVVMREGEFTLDIRDGSMRYRLPDSESFDRAEYESAEKIEELAREFIEFFACGEDEDPGDTGYKNTRSKPSQERDGGEKMTEDYDSVEDVNRAVIEGEVTDLDETMELLEDHRSDDPSHAEVYLVFSTLEYQALQTGEDLEEYLDEENGPMADIIGDISDDVSSAGSAVAATRRNARRQISEMEETEMDLKHAYVTHMLEGAYSFADVAERNNEERERLESYTEELEEIADSIESVTPRDFSSTTDEQMREELEELRRVSGLPEREDGSGE